MKILHHDNKNKDLFFFVKIIPQALETNNKPLLTTTSFF